MFSRVVKTSSIGLQDIAKALTWSFKDVKQCVRHTSCAVHRPNILFKTKITRCRYKNQLNSLRFSTSAERDETVQQITRSPEEIQEFMKQNELHIKGMDDIKPMLSLHETGFPHNILSVLSKMGVSEPTPIQAITWPVALEGRDMVGISKTGSGKTLGFAVPAILHIQDKKKKAPAMPQVLVLSPTRELALQIHKVFQGFANTCGFRPVCIFGGGNKFSQISDLDKGAHVCTATPGRCLDFLNSGVLTLDQTTYVVIDEADRMMEIGFLPQVQDILRYTKNEKQVLMWSATWPQEVEGLAAKYMSNFVRLSVGGLKLKANPNVKQMVIVVPPSEKRERLLKLLRDMEDNYKALVFAETKLTVIRLERFLRENGVRAVAVHGDKSQNARLMALRDFRSGASPVLVSTAVAARGLDVDNISHVINFDTPQFADEYVHKIGRTARHNKKGTAITFCGEGDNTKYLVDMLREAGEKVPTELLELAPKGNQSKRGLRFASPSEFDFSMLGM
ncbi:UNVERIFIED_CONTAM: hypothetical protein PYX00_008396 [Menopon gallinae]|uniref:RNA helicase n=1 Tax=Menopon gallinae TaxID=328185 RepID=A0AAW2HNX8_9NEOP